MFSRCFVHSTRDIRTHNVHLYTIFANQAPSYTPRRFFRQKMLTGVNITFLGTASAQPSSTRNHSALALRLSGDVWLFDCGEATQHQIQRSKVKMGKIQKAFITHTHGTVLFAKSLAHPRAHRLIFDTILRRSYIWYTAFARQSFKWLGRDGRRHRRRSPRNSITSSRGSLTRSPLSHP